MKINEYIGVYHADGGLVGEAKYVLGHLVGRAHCSLCDITHSPLRRKKQWDSLTSALPVPFRVYHLNDMPADVAAMVAVSGSPVVLARTEQGLVTLLRAWQLEQLDGSVEAFDHALAASVTPPLSEGIA